MNKERTSPHSLALSTPVGRVILFCSDNGLTSLAWSGQEDYPRESTHPHLLCGREELLNYFSGRLQRFTVPVDFSSWQGFPLRVYEELSFVPYGETVTYGELARRAGQPRGARAVGRLMARNPLPIVLPCHRVIAADGALTGYSGGEGIATKRYLLTLEKTA